MTADWPAVAGINASVYVIPTDAPEADGTLAWNETTMVLVTARQATTKGSAGATRRPPRPAWSPTCWPTW